MEPPDACTKVTAQIDAASELKRIPVQPKIFALYAPDQVSSATALTSRIENFFLSNDSSG
jgi:hypothetical protein